MFALIAAPARRADRSGPMPSRQAVQGRGMRRCESVKDQRDEQKKVTVIGRNRTSIFKIDTLHTHRQAIRFVTKQHQSIYTICFQFPFYDLNEICRDYNAENEGI